MHRPGLAGSGWLPAALTWVLVAFALVSTGVALRDVLVFTAYVVLCLLLPGTLLWRAVEGDSPRPFVHDLVLGTCLAYTVELFWYLAVRAAGAPLLVLAWPVLVVAASLLPRWRSRLWRPSQTHQMSAGWSWGMATAVVFVVAFLARRQWAYAAISGGGLRSMYADAPYHLSLVAELRNHLPVSSPVVAGEPLYYHWFLHAEVAASSWATAIEPVVLLQRLSLVPMIVLTLMGAGIVVDRLTGSTRFGLLAPVLLVAGGLASMVEASSAEKYDLWLNARMYISPTITFSELVLVPVLALGLRLLRADVPAPRRLWVTAALALSALSASKATVLPFVAAGFLGVVVLGAVRRRLERRALALFALCVVVSLVARQLVYGNQARGVRWDPLVLYHFKAAQVGLADSPQSAGLGLAVLMLVVYLIQQLSFAAGVVGLFRAGRWQDPRAQFLVGAAAAGTVASFTLAAQANSQQHFIRTTPVVWAVASAWGFSLLLPRKEPRRLVLVLVAVAVLAAGVAMTLEVLDQRGEIGLLSQATIWGLLQPYVFAGVGVLVLVATWVVVAGRTPQWRGTTAAVAVAACLGLGMASVAGFVVDVAHDPGLPAVPPPPAESATVGVGGISAARWLRAHSDPDDLVATNRHCRNDPEVRRCDNRMFWLSAFSERHVVLEGWAYQVRTAERSIELGKPSCCLPFWDRHRLRQNDAAFRGVPHAVNTLRDVYGVRWMVLDLRSSHNLHRLTQHAEVRYRQGDYVVLELTPDT